MNNSRKVPPDIEQIFKNPEWPLEPQERERVKAWLWDMPQMKYFLIAAVNNLRRRGYAGRPDKIAREVEDAFCDFMIYGKIDEVIDIFDPDKAKELDKAYCFLRFAAVGFGLFYFSEFRKNLKEKRRMVPMPESMEGIESQEWIESLANRATANDMSDKIGLKLDIAEALSQLEPAYQEVIMKKFKEDKSIAKIAEELEITPNNAKVRLYRAKEMLKKLLTDYSPDKFAKEGNDEQLQT